jgi:hypothetical protein
MAKLKYKGLDLEIKGEHPSIQELRAIKDLDKIYSEKVNPSGVSDQDIDPSTGYYKLPEVPSKIRFAASAAPNLKSKIATLEKFYSKVTQDEFDPSNFIVEDTSGKKFILDDKSKTNFGDVIDFGKEASQVVGSTVGAVAGTAVMPGVGTVAGAGGGMALGSEFYERLGQLAGTEIDRDLDEYLKTRGTEVLFGSVAQTAGPLLLRGGKFLFRGSDKPMIEANKDILGVGTKEAKSIYNSLNLQQKIDKNLKLTMPDRLTLFKQYEIKPTLGQLTENPIIDSFETAFARVPVSAQILKRGAERAQNELGKRYTEAITKSLDLVDIPKTKDVTGVIRRGLSGKKVKAGDLDPGDASFGIFNANGFVSRFRTDSDYYYGKLSEALKGVPEAQKKVGMTNVQNFFEEQVKGIGLKNLDRVMDDPFLAKYYKAFLKDVSESGGKINYTKADKFRQKIGQKLSNPMIYADEQRGLYKALYRSISDDISNTLEKIPGKKGNTIRAAKRDAFNHTKEGRALIDDFVNPLMKKVDIDTITSQLLTKAKGGDTALNGLMKALGPDRSRVLVASMIDKLGKPTTGAGGQMGAIGRSEVFSSETFLQNLRQMSPEAREALFANKIFKGKDYGTLNRNLKDIEAIASYIDLQNPFKGQLGQAATKGEAGVGLIIGAGATVAGGAIAGGATGGLLGGAAFLAGVPLLGFGGATISKMLSNPKFVEWVASTTKGGALRGFDGAVENFFRLGAVAGKSSQEEAELSNQYLEIIKQSSEMMQQNQQQQQMNQQNQQAEQNLQQTATGAPSAPSAPAPVNTQVTDPLQYGALFPQDSLGQAIAQRKVI